jgi:hypothetical protein
MLNPVAHWRFDAFFNRVAVHKWWRSKRPGQPTSCDMILSLCMIEPNGSVRISVRLSCIMSERLMDATSILHCELEAPPV